MLSEEQQLVLDTINSNTDKITAVNAVAGSGKTHTASAIINSVKPKNGFYTAFNKAIVTDSSKRFGNLINCKTIHALAYKYVKPSRPIEDLSYLTIKEDISYEDKNIVIEAIDDFFRSDSVNIEDFARTKTTSSYLQNLICAYANKMLEGEIPPTFNYLLKCLHIMLLNEEIEIGFDLLILDECQDTTAVALEIFKLIKANKKVILGDKFQNIYSFMNTVNAFEELKDLEVLHLTKSFRCNPNIADIVDAFGKCNLEESFCYRGNEEIPTETKSIAYITRTNSALIARMYNLLKKNVSFTLTRKADEIFALPIALLNASNGKPVYDSKYRFLQYEYERYNENRSAFRNYFDYLDLVVKDSVIENTCKILLTLNAKGINIYDLKNKVKSIKPNPSIILTTAHAFKGLEADSVYIEDDLNTSVNKAIQSMKEASNFTGCSLQAQRQTLSKSKKEDLNTYYVALSRARSTITNVGYTR